MSFERNSTYWVYFINHFEITLEGYVESLFQLFPLILTEKTIFSLFRLCESSFSKESSLKICHERMQLNTTLSLSVARYYHWS